MTEVAVYVVVDGRQVIAGTLYAHRRRGTESATFAYTTDYLATPGAYALDPALPLRTGAQQTRVGRALFSAFTDCAPDRWGRTLLGRREGAIEGVSARATEELHDLWRRIVFSVLISNTDDHLRNHGFLHQRADVWQLAPAFDLNPNPDTGPKYLSTAIDDSDDGSPGSRAFQ